MNDNRGRMELWESYRNLKGSIVAFCAKYQPINSPEEQPLFPRIIGTGFVARSDGLVVTNEHVVQAFRREYRPPGTPPDDHGVVALLFYMMDEGQVEIPLEVIGCGGISAFDHGPSYYGPKRPDVAFVHVKMKGLPVAHVVSKGEILEGTRVATAGFPMGTDTLVAPGYVHQLTPTLQEGIVSAVLPYACEAPHAFMINVMTQGGASGSPVFDPVTGDILGVLYAGLSDIGQTEKKDLYKVPTNISYVVPYRFINLLLRWADESEDVVAPDDARTVDGILEGAELHNALEGRRWDVMDLRVRRGQDESGD
jgi:hypothetical protein